MTTLTGPAAAGTGAPPPAHARPKEPASSRVASWRNSWAVALRMARRDVRRHKGRSLIVLLMVGIPTALLVFGLTLNATSTITGAEHIPYALGDAAARVQAPQPNAVTQSFDLNNSGGGSGKPATAVPGFTNDGTLRAQTEAISRFFHGTAVPIKGDSGRIVVGSSSRQIDVTIVDGREGLGSLARLVSGRWPTTPDEIAINDAAIEIGVPTSGRVEYRIQGQNRTVTVVGVVEPLRLQTGPHIVTVPDMNATGAASEWLILRNEPVPWSEVQAANAHGVTVLSAAVLRDPPPTSALDPDQQLSMQFDATQQRQLMTIGGTILLLVTTLLVGPAFAVSAARSRRTLALAAASGGSTAMLRRTVLAQALVLGALSALAGSALGVAATKVVSSDAFARHVSSVVAGPFEVPVLQIAAVTGVAMLASVIAALVPARRLGRIDIVGVMKGQNVSPKLSRVLPIVGAAGAGVGGVMLFNAIATQQTEIPVVIGGILLIGGALLLVPMCIVLIAKGAARLPVALRMATRDAARQRTRSAPSVAAIVGAIAALTMIGVGLTSDTEQQRRDYQPQAQAGEGYVVGDFYSDPGLANEVERQIHQADPSLSTSQVGNLQPMFGGPSPESVEIPFVQVIPAGCTLAQTLAPPESAGAPPGQKPKCARLGSVNYMQWSGISILDANTSSTLLGLSPEQVAKVRAGGAIVIGDPSVGSTLRVATGTGTQDQMTGGIANAALTSETNVPVAAHIPVSKEVADKLQSQPGLILTPELAAKNKWHVNVERILVRDPSGPISTQRQDRLSAAVRQVSSEVYIERGFQRLDAKVMSIVVGIFVFLVLVITLTSTALSLAEQRKDDATLAALGATRRTRRGMAAAQAFMLAGIGAVIGFLVGLVPGVAIAYPLTREGGSCDPLTGVCQMGEPIIAIPWLWMGLAIIGTPLLAAAIAWLSVRRAPVMTRRTT